VPRDILTKELVTTGPSELPIAMPTLYLHMLLLKLNSTEGAVLISSMKILLGKSGG